MEDLNNKNFIHVCKYAFIHSEVYSYIPGPKFCIFVILLHVMAVRTIINLNHDIYVYRYIRRQSSTATHLALVLFSNTWPDGQKQPSTQIS